MQFSTARRSGKTYGKTNKNAIVHDFFDQGTRSNNTASRTLPNASSGPDSDPEHTSRPAASAISDLAPPPLSEEASGRQIASELKTSLIQDTSVFDINSSDEDTSTDTSDSRASKRRRVTKPLNGATPQVKSDSHDDISEPPPARTVTKKLKKNKDSLTAGSVTSNGPKKLTVLQPAKKLSKAKDILSQPRTGLKETAKRHPLPHAAPHQSSTAMFSQNDASRSVDQDISKIPEPLSDQSEKSPPLANSSPRPETLKQTPADSDHSSPGQLGLNALALGNSDLSPARFSPAHNDDRGFVKKKGRQRLVDRLDVPSKNAEATSDDPMSDVSNTPPTSKRQTSSKKPNELLRGRRKTHQLQKPAATLGDSEPSQTRAAWTTKPRTTYATQRSHLSDMVDELDGLSAPPSQRSAEDLLGQVPVSNVTSQLELEDESDDQTGAGRLKSIHELRQSGANNRFDREIDALLEDASATDRASKALRLQALMKLIARLREPGFLRHFALSSRMQRLTSLSNQPTDLPNSILLVSAFLMLARSENITVNNLGQIFKACSDLAPDMLVDTRSLVKIAKERKQNLSKAMVQDLVEFEKPNDTKEQSSTLGSSCSDMVALGCLEYTLRKLIQLGDVSARLSTALYTNILHVVQSQVRRLVSDDYDPAGVTKLETALSLLELCSVVVDEADLHIGDENYKALGHALAEILNRTSKLPESLERSVLRVVVSLSNNKPRMCRLLGDSPINKAIFGVINKDFVRLAKQAEDEQILDEGKLDSVLLALGCLLNFAECDSTFRERLSVMRAGEGNHIKQLISIFNYHVSKIDEAVTKEQSQISVAFGYLSMLLCTLSLHPSIRAQVTQLLNDRSFEQLCAVAEKFFSHLRTLEHMSEDDASMSAFTARFHSILETIRASST